MHNQHNTDNGDKSSRPDVPRASASGSSGPSHIPATPYDHVFAPIRPQAAGGRSCPPWTRRAAPRAVPRRAAMGGGDGSGDGGGDGGVKLTSDRRNVAHVGGRGGRTFAPAVALAVEEGSPSSAVRLGPIHWMGRAVRSKAHALSGHTMPAPMSSKSASAAISDRVQDHVQRAKHSSAW